MQNPSVWAGGVFFLIWLAMMVGMIVGYIILLVALWRAMKAHEAIARSASDIASALRQREGQ